MKVPHEVPSSLRARSLLIVSCSRRSCDHLPEGILSGPIGLATPYYYFFALCLGARSGTDPTIQVDGNFSDWANGAIATADQRYIFFRIDLPDLVNLQKCKDSITVEVDFDNDQKTGRSIRSEKPPGVDIEFVFSPPSQDAMVQRVLLTQIAESQQSGSTVSLI